MTVLGQSTADDVIDIRPGAAADLARVASRIRQSERRFRSLIENATDLFVICDAEGRPIYVSPSVYGIAGVNPEDVLGQPSHELHHPDDLPRVIDAFAVAMEVGTAEVDFRIRHRDGSWRWMELAVTNLLHDPDIEGLVLTGRDVTERRHAEEALRVSEERWRALLLNSTDAITVLGEGGTVLYTSPSTERLLGYAPDTITNMAVFELVHPDDLERAAAILLELLEQDKGGSDAIEMRVRHADGTYRWIEAVANNLLDHPAVGGIVVNVRDVTERKRAQEELARQALRDSLTGLANRALLVDRLASALSRSERTGKLTGVLFLDLDHFKLVNDSLGHALGDQLLIALAERLDRFLRKGDTAARLGGDEFVLCCDGLESYEAAADIADRVADVLGEPVVLDGHDLSVTVSVGITCACDESRKPEELLRDADLAMYRAKDRGRARSEVFLPSMHTRARERLEQQLDVRRALTAGQFRMTYQPVIRLSNGELAGAEALVRWAHPRRGLVLPCEFIPAAEETGLIEPLGTWVLAQSIAEAAAWNRESAIPLGVSVNLSARQIAGGQLPDLIGTALEVNGLDARRLCLEITESLLVEEPEEVTTVLKELAAMGIRIAIDDFGTGYSSLAYLKRFPVEIIKIDQSFISGIEFEGENRAIVAAIIGLASSLGLKVIAEGVETAEQLDVVRELGCDIAQGFYISHPVPPEAFEDLVARGGTW
jgi:diguanylate cyclase (GGDEF)-like protein/PAS domain S-box-containing protein